MKFCGTVYLTVRLNKKNIIQAYGNTKDCEENKYSNSQAYEAPISATHFSEKL